MKDELRHPGYFLGVQTPFGCIHHADTAALLPGRRCIALDQLPPTLLDRVLRRTAHRLEEAGQEVLTLRSPHRPEQLEGLLLPGADVLVLGADRLTHPLARSCACRLLPGQPYTCPPAHPEELARLHRRREDALAQARVFLRIAAAAAELNRSTLRLTVDEHKLRRLTESICRQELPEAPRSGRAPRREERFLTAVTGQGQYICGGGPAQRICLLEDAHSSFAPDLLDQLEAAAHSRGYDTVVCRCPLAPNTRTEHLFLPELSLGFVTSNSAHAIPVDPCRVINSRRFTTPQQLRRAKEQLLQNKQIQRQMLTQAGQYLQRAEELRREMEALTTAPTPDPDRAAEQLAHRLEQALAGA